MNKTNSEYDINIILPEKSVLKIDPDDEMHELEFHSREDFLALIDVTIADIEKSYWFEYEGKDPYVFGTIDLMRNCELETYFGLLAGLGDNIERLGGSLKLVSNESLHIHTDTDIMLSITNF